MAYVSTDTVSAHNTPRDTRLRDRKMVPLGAAVWTGSGKLADEGITGIAHAAAGAMNPSLGAGFDPTTQSVTTAIRNAFLLAAAHGHESLAVPFVGGGIFYTRISPPIDREDLAAVIVDACHEYRGDLECTLVGFDANDMSDFSSAMAEVDDDGLRLVRGSITAIGDHGCTAIVNAANMEVVFGGGISGVIARATGTAKGIDREAAAAVREFWSVNG